MKLRAVMDTNVMVSGMLWRGVPFELLRWAEKNSLVIYTSLEILCLWCQILNSELKSFVRQDSQDFTGYFLPFLKKGKKCQPSSRVNQRGRILNINY